ncbi:hypothetical protein [Rhodoplanes roseus]|nr:hypothetical protein [Rhodoplanes roseus]
MARHPILDGDERVDMGPLLRLVAWGLTAAGALAIAVLAAQSHMGERRVAAATAPLAAQTEAARAGTAQALVRTGDVERETKRLGDTIKALEADRDKLSARVAALESSLEDLTGSIALIQPARRAPPGSDITDLFSFPPSIAPAPFKPAEPARRTTGADGAPAPAASPDPRAMPPMEPREPMVPTAAPVMAATSPVPPEIEPAVATVAGTVAGMSPADIPLPRPNPMAQTLGAQTAALRSGAEAAPPGGEAGKRFAIEVGAPASIDGLKALWTKLREGQSGDLLADLKPAVALRDGGKPGIVEMRLVAGPVPTSLAASRLCASLAISGVACRATPYKGQMLNLP